MIPQPTTLEIRPAGGRWNRDQLGVALVFAAGSIAFAARSGTAAWWVITICVLAGGLTLGLKVTARNRACLRVDDGDVKYTGLCGERTVLGHGEAGKVVHLTTSAGTGPTVGPGHYWSIVDLDGRSRLALSSRAWSATDLEGLRQARGRPLETISASTLQDAADKLPGLLPRWFQIWLGKRWTFTSIFVFALIALISLIEVIAGKNPGQRFRHRTIRRSHDSFGDERAARGFTTRTTPMPRI